MRRRQATQAFFENVLLVGARWPWLSGVEFEAALPHLPFAYIHPCMQELEDAGAVEIAGDVWAIRHSEIRLTVCRNEV